MAGTPAGVNGRERSDRWSSRRETGRSPPAPDRRRSRRPGMSYQCAAIRGCPSSRARRRGQSRRRRRRARGYSHRPSGRAVSEGSRSSGRTNRARPAPAPIRPIHAGEKAPARPKPLGDEGIGGAAGGQFARKLAVLVGDQQRHHEADDDSRAESPRRPALPVGMVLKKIEAAGDITATEMTMAWRRPRLLRAKSAAVGVAASSAALWTGFRSSAGLLIRHLHIAQLQDACFTVLVSFRSVACAHRGRYQRIGVEAIGAGSRSERRHSGRAPPARGGSRPSGDSASPASRRRACASCPSGGAHHTR